MRKKLWKCGPGKEKGLTSKRLPSGQVGTIQSGPSARGDIQRKRNSANVAVAKERSALCFVTCPDLWNHSVNTSSELINLFQFSVNATASGLSEDLTKSWSWAKKRQLRRLLVKLLVQESRKLAAKAKSMQEQMLPNWGFVLESQVRLLETIRNANQNAKAKN